MLGKIFVITGEINTLASLFYGTMPALTDFNSYFSLYQTAGQNVGAIARILLNFKGPRVVSAAFPYAYMNK
jgi:hypothetical protein